MKLPTIYSRIRSYKKLFASAGFFQIKGGAKKACRDDDRTEDCQDYCAKRCGLYALRRGFLRFSTIHQGLNRLRKKAAFWAILAKKALLELKPALILLALCGG
jgi:hypothetical protein